MPDGSTAMQLLSPGTAPALPTDFPLLAFLLAAWLHLMGRALSWAQRQSVRFGLSPRFTFARYGRLLRTAGGAGMVLVVARWLAVDLATLWGVAVVAVGVTVLAVTGVMQDVVAGLYVQYRLDLREGDRLRVGEREGALSALAWDHVTLRAADGSLHHLPNRLLARGAVEVQPARAAVPMCVRVAMSGDDGLARLRDAVAVSPYRVAGTPLSVRVDGDQLEVRCYLWSDPARIAAEAAIHALARADARSR